MTWAWWGASNAGLGLGIFRAEKTFVSQRQEGEQTVKSSLPTYWTWAAEEIGGEGGAGGYKEMSSIVGSVAD